MKLDVSVACDDWIHAARRQSLSFGVHLVYRLPDIFHYYESDSMFKKKNQTPLCKMSTVWHRELFQKSTTCVISRDTRTADLKRHVITRVS